MRFTDIIRLAGQNLLRRKSRTFLTVLGVVVGCCSILIMVSLGQGMNEQNTAMLKQMGDLTIITVTPQYGNGGGQDGGSNPSGAGGTKAAKLTNQSLKDFKSIPGVEGVSPQETLDISTNVTAGPGGRFSASNGMLTIQGMDLTQLKAMGYTITKGHEPTRPGEVLAGQNTAYAFTDKFRGPQDNYRIPPDQGIYQCTDPAAEDCLPAHPQEPFFDQLKTPFEVSKLNDNDGGGGGAMGGGGMVYQGGYATLARAEEAEGTSGDAAYRGTNPAVSNISGASDSNSGTTSSTNNGNGSSGASSPTMKLNAVGTLKGDYNKGGSTQQGFLMSMEDFARLKKNVDPSGTSGSAGGTSKQNYSTAIVKVSDISQVASVQNTIRSMGFYTSSSDDMRKQMEKESRIVQLILGGIGAVAFLVAAIGIANTMIMSVTERTREIGIMKALGCTVHDIRVMFLTEAAAIGMVGGVIGGALSALASLGMNLIALGGMSLDNIGKAILGGEDVTRMSVIPWWLFICAVIFSMAVGLVFGFAPANKAVKIPALDAIKNEQ